MTLKPTCVEIENDCGKFSVICPDMGSYEDYFCEKYVLEGVVTDLEEYTRGYKAGWEDAMEKARKALV